MISLRRQLLRAGLLYFEAKLRAGFQVMLRVCELRLHVEERPAIRSFCYFPCVACKKPEIGNCARCTWDEKDPRSGPALDAHFAT